MAAAKYRNAHGKSLVQTLVVAILHTQWCTGTPVQITALGKYQLRVSKNTAEH